MRNKKVIFEKVKLRNHDLVIHQLFEGQMRIMKPERTKKSLKSTAKLCRVFDVEQMFKVGIEVKVIASPINNCGSIC